MSEAAREGLLTFEDVERMDPDDEPGELVEGRWVPVTRNTWRHGQLVLNLGMLLKTWARAHPGWSISAGDPGTKLARNPDTLRGPDVAVLRADRVPEGRGAKGWVEGSPEVVVEVIGDAQSIGEATSKALQFLAAGARIVWLIDDRAERVLVMTPPDHVRVLGRGAELDGGDVLEGFRCTVDDIFAP